MNKPKESGQATVFVALMMIAFISIAAFAINASYAFYQHTQMQASVDTATRYAAGNNSCSGTTPAGIVLQTPPQSSPYTGLSNYCEGHYNKPIDSMFGSMLKFPVNISVHAVAVGGGSTVKKAQAVVVAYDTGLCDISNQDSGSNTIINAGSASNPAVAINSTDGQTCGNVQLVGLKNSPAPSINPYAPSSPLPVYNTANYPLGDTVCINSTGISSWNCTYSSFSAYFAALGTAGNCHSKIDAEITGSSSIDPPLSNGLLYYFPARNSNGYVRMPADSGATFGQGGVQYKLYDFCGGQSPGIYYFNIPLKFSSGSTSMYTFNSTLVYGPTVTVDSSGGVSWSLNAPTNSGAVMYDSKYSLGIAVWEDTSLPCPSGHPDIDMFGNTGSYVKGIVDTVCSNLFVTGSSDNTITGAVVGWDIGTAGSGTTTINAPGGGLFGTFNRGAFLVQ